jgi:hypothetical protein
MQVQRRRTFSVSTMVPPISLVTEQRSTAIESSVTTGTATTNRPSDPPSRPVGSDLMTKQALDPRPPDVLRARSASESTGLSDWLEKYERRLREDDWSPVCDTGPFTAQQQRDDDDKKQAQSDDVRGLIALMEFNSITRNWLREEGKREQVVACLTRTKCFEEDRKGLENLVFESPQRLDPRTHGVYREPLDMTREFDEFLMEATKPDDAQLEEGSLTTEEMLVEQNAPLEHAS